MSVVICMPARDWAAVVSCLEWMHTHGTTWDNNESIEKLFDKLQAKGINCPMERNGDIGTCD